jgi:hypothetical protein
MKKWTTQMSEWVSMLLRLIFNNRQWFGGRLWEVEEVLVTLADLYGITVNPPSGGTEWIKGIFERSYSELYGHSDFINRWSDESKRVFADLEDYVHHGKLPYYVMRKRIECVSAQLTRALQQ